MTAPTAGKLIIPFGEGPGDEAALPALIRRLAKGLPDDLTAGSNIHIHHTAWKVGQLQKLLKNDGQFWKDRLTLANQKGASAVLLVVDGDRPSNLGTPPLCVGSVAKQLANYARQAGAGKIFSTAVVIARQEMESWFIAGAESLKKQKYAGQPLLVAAAETPEGNLENSPRDAKGWLSEHMERGYKETLHQVEMAKAVDFAQIRQRQMRSFQRLEHAVAELCQAIQTNQPVCSPA